MKVTNMTVFLPGEPMLNLLMYCVDLLRVHGYITDGERKKIHARILKRKQREEKVTNGIQN